VWFVREMGASLGRTGLRRLPAFRNLFVCRSRQGAAGDMRRGPAVCLPRRRSAIESGVRIIRAPFFSAPFQAALPLAFIASSARRSGELGHVVEGAAIAGDAGGRRTQFDDQVRPISACGMVASTDIPSRPVGPERRSRGSGRAAAGSTQ